MSDNLDPEDFLRLRALELAVRSQNTSDATTLVGAAAIFSAFLLGASELPKAAATQEDENSPDRLRHAVQNLRQDMSVAFGQIGAIRKRLSPSGGAGQS